MFSRETTLTNELGLHARPASKFVQKANQYQSEISVLKDGEQANAKSISDILKLGVSQGTTITIEAEGEDEEEAVTGLVELIENKLEKIEQEMDQ